LKIVSSFDSSGLFKINDKFHFHQDFNKEMNEFNYVYINSEKNLRDIITKISKKFSSGIFKDFLAGDGIVIEFSCFDYEYRVYENIIFILNSGLDIYSKNDWKSFININYIYGDDYFAIQMVNKWFLFLLFDII
jgi:hypothetical protein